MQSKEVTLTLKDKSNLNLEILKSEILTTIFLIKKHNFAILLEKKIVISH